MAKSDVWLFVIVMSIAAQSALADQIVMKNGDRLTGAIHNTDEKGLTIKSAFAGTVTIPMDAIVQIVSDQPLYLTLKDKQVVVGTLSTPEAGKVQVKTSETGVVALAKDSIQNVRSKDAQAAFEAQIERLRNPRLSDLWSGSADVGISLARGNAATSNISLGMNAARATTRDKFSVYAASLYAQNSTTGKSLTTANAKRGGGRYDVNIARTQFAFGFADLEFDQFQKLDLRLVLGGGWGWHASKTERTALDFFGGGSMDREYFSTGLKRTSAELLMGQELTHKMSSRASIREKLVFLPNMNDTGQYRMNFDASAVMALNTWLGWHVTFSDRYLSNPVPGAKSNDVLFTTGLRVTFSR